MARKDGLSSDLEPSGLLEVSSAVIRRQKQTLEVDHVNETVIEKTDEERIGGISRPVVAPPPDVTGPFYLFRPIAQGNTEGALATTNSAGRSDLQQLLQNSSAGAVSQGKKIKSSLSSFLPTIPGDIDNPGLGDTSLRTLFHKPPIGGKELVNLPPHLLHGFKLRPGQIPEQFRTAFHEKPKKKKRKKPKLLALEQRQETQSVPDGRRDSSANPGLLGFTGTAKTIPVAGVTSELSSGKRLKYSFMCSCVAGILGIMGL
jgi:hypothetical protein